MASQENITVQGARVNNLKNISVEIPRNSLVVITGLSGSGKSSLAFDTLYAEGQRRYVESLSAYARQFLGRMSKPEVDFIKGLPPAIAIQQKVNTHNPRSTVGTSTEIYEYIKLLFARIGKTVSPVSGVEVKKHTVEDVVSFATTLPLHSMLIVLSPIDLENGRTLHQQLELLKTQGFSRVKYGGQYARINDLLKENLSESHAEVMLVIDRLEVTEDAEMKNRLADSVETAFFEGKNSCIVEVQTGDEVQSYLFSKAFEADGMTFEEPSEQLFSFNNPLGACPVCEGFGRVIGIDENLVIPNRQLSVYEDTVACWRGEVVGEWKQEVIRGASAVGFPIHRPYFQLTKEEKALLWDGCSAFHGIRDFFQLLEGNQYKIQYRVMLARYRGKTVCPECNGTRLRKQAQWVKVGGNSITELVDLPIRKLKEFFTALELEEHEQVITKRLMVEIMNRLQFLLDVGLGYLTLNRLSNTLSGGESQRINLATSLGSSLVGSLYILDEPSIGLHARDTGLLIKVLLQLRDLGNTVVVVEHDKAIMEAADYIIDMGPGAGRLGGEVVLSSPMPLPEQTAESSSRSFTFRYLTGQEAIPVPQHRRKWNNYIEIEGAAENNLKYITVRFPLNIFTVVTGVSGSGKSSLVRGIFYPVMKKELGGVAPERPGNYGSVSGSLHLVSDIEFVDQNPIGKSSRSNPVTYLKAYDEIRRLFSEQQLAKQMGFTPSTFSFNVEGGRCETCQGEGVITVEMQFMADITLTCDECHGKRFKSDVLEVKYHGSSIFDVLEMTVNQSIEFFSSSKGVTEKRIVKRLKPLQDVGLGYVKLGQSSSTLSGGESQRVKLASFLAEEKSSPMLFVFDEPTTGLHFHDIKTLLKAFDALIERGHTVVVIEHNPEVIKCADHVIDLGPDSGEDGGEIVFEGTPEALMQCERSVTGRYLKEELA
ncbi:excinuclease ABC subunit UvrA [Microbacter margulisiae]|uniref:UvrABC system protein A n=1 Tax=Microbacter margulisiae TaxID=1350067 RepID=A0A7W5DSB6_9PORP|nr:excinuclease ABC subunit UvrA [Microbacter margulisiae]MBB3187838.1 excinuclease ABC subunit A [Microbacter margulisiae]